MKIEDHNTSLRASAVVSKVVQKFTEQAVGHRLVNNVVRGLLIESIIALELEPEWDWKGGNYSSWDFEHKSGARLEVKQSAAQQSWNLAPSGKKSPARFDIAARTGRYEGQNFVKKPGRAAQLFLFAYHPIEGGQADHRDPLQWEFYVALERDLPQQKSIGLKRVRSISRGMRTDALLGSLSQMLAMLKIDQRQ